MQKIKKIEKQKKKKIKVIRSKTDQRPNRINRKLRNKMLELWLVKQSINYVARKANVHALTVKRYMEKDDWDHAYEIYSKRMQKRVVTKSINRTSRNINALDIGIKSILKYIRQKAKEGKHVSPLMLDRFIKVQEEILRNNPDEVGEQETPDEVHAALKVLAGMSEKDIKGLGDYIASSDKIMAGF